MNINQPAIPMMLDHLSLPGAAFKKVAQNSLPIRCRRVGGLQYLTHRSPNRFFRTPAINQLRGAIPTLDAELHVRGNDRIAHTFLNAGVIAKLALLRLALGNVADNTHDAIAFNQAYG